MNWHNNQLEKEVVIFLLKYSKHTEKTYLKYATKYFGYKEKTKMQKKLKYGSRGIHKVERQKTARKIYK